MENKKLTDEFIRGLVVGEGCFTFCTRPAHDSLGNKCKEKIPAFSIGMNVRDLDLIREVRNSIGLRNTIYVLKSSNKDGYKNRGNKVVLIIRELSSLRNKIIPLFYGKLHGYKAIQFQEWLEKIGNDEAVPYSYKKLYWIYKSGFYDEYLKTGSLAEIRDLNI